MTHIKTIHVKAPGRVCLFGDHQDYLGLPVIACAIDRYIEMWATPNNSQWLNFDFVDLKTSKTLNLNEDYSQFEARDYIKSTLKVLKDKGVELSQGYDIKVSGDIPINAGLSSSSALVVGWLTAVLKICGRLDEFSAAEIGHLGYLAECVEHGESGGKMDQYTSAIGGAIFIETDKDMAYESLELPFDALIIAESGLPKQTLEGLKNLNQQAHTAIKEVKEQHRDFELSKINSSHLGQYVSTVNPELWPIFAAAVYNHQITQDAAKLIRLGNADRTLLAGLIYEHHKVLRDNLKVSTAQIEQLIKAAMDSGAPGAKIVGSGGGGCIAVLCSNRVTDKVVLALKSAGATQVFEARISKGAKELNL